MKNWIKEFDKEFMSDGELLVPEGKDDAKDLKTFIQQVEDDAIERSAKKVEELVIVDESLCSCRSSDCGESVERHNNEYIHEVVIKAIRNLKS